MILGIVLLVVGLIWLWLIRIDRLTIQFRGAAALCATFGAMSILFEAFG